MKAIGKELLTKKELGRIAGTILGSFLYVVGLNIFVVPVGVYSGGVMGICQILRTILVDYFHLPFTNFDIAGIIYYIANIPIMYIAYKFMGRLFFIKTAICMTTMTIFFSIVPIPSQLLMTNDMVTSCLIGGILAGVGCGLTLMMGGSAGGMDLSLIHI